MKRAALTFFLVLAACTPSPERYVRACAEESAAADRAIARGDREGAIDALRAIVEREVPASVAGEDARVIRQDAYDRWGRLELEAGELERAEGAVEAALALGERDDLFTAGLLTTRGRIHEARGREREAARDYHRALVIEEALLERALGGSDE